VGVFDASPSSAHKGSAADRWAGAESKRNTYWPSAAARSRFASGNRSERQRTESSDNELDQRLTICRGC
jgi:hypothetical protein